MEAFSSDMAFEVARSLYEIRDYEGALARCGEILAAKPDHAAALALATTIRCRSDVIAGYRINLENRADRVAECRRNEAEFGYPDDFAPLLKAVPDEFGAIGCGKSHILALTDALVRRKSPFCMVLEDDFDFLRPAADLIRSLDHMQSCGLRWDVLLLAGNEVLPYHQPPAAPFLLRLLDSQTTAGYIVNRPYIPTLLASFTESVAQLERFRAFQPRKPVVERFAIDIGWKTLQRRDHWYIANPSFGHQRPGFSDIEGKMRDYSGSTFYRL